MGRVSLAGISKMQLSDNGHCGPVDQAPPIFRMLELYLRAISKPDIPPEFWPETAGRFVAKIDMLKLSPGISDGFVIFDVEKSSLYTLRAKGEFRATSDG